MRLRRVALYRAAEPLDLADERVAPLLRDDLAFVQPEGDLTLVAFAVMSSGGVNTGPGQPSSRWADLGIEFTAGPACDVTEVDLADWITYRHPFIERPRRDLGRLVPVTLAAALAARSEREI